MARNELVRDVVGELREVAERGPRELGPDVDIVWVLSAPGTYYDEAQAGAYSGVAYDRLNIEAGIAAMYDITAARLGKPVEEVTKDDVEQFGPLLYYNGEDMGTDGSEAVTQDAMFPQNEHFRRALNEPDFPLSSENVCIRPIPGIGTHRQVEEFAQFLSKAANGQELPVKIAVVSLFGHAPRVGRFLQHNLSSYPAGVEFTSVPVEQPEGKYPPFVAWLGEARKVNDYFANGWLARVSVFVAHGDEAARG